MKNRMKRKRVKTSENVLYLLGWIAILVIIATLISAYIIISVFPEVLEYKVPPCMIHLVTGLYCPGCGGTRAVLALLRGRVWTSFLYHPLVLYAALFGGWFMISHTIEKFSKGRIAIGMKYRELYLWIALILVVGNFVVKNILLLCGMDVLTMLR